MDGSPRSSKRRKLDTPARGASSPLRHASSARKSGRLATRAVSYTNGEVQEARALRGSKSTTGMRHTHGATEEADVWDDIEGALGEKPTTQLQPSASKQRPSTSQNKAGTSKRAHTEDTTSTGDMTDELQPTTSTPKGRNVNGTVKRDSASRFSFRSLVNGYRHGTGTEPDIQIAADASTPSRDTDQLRPARRPGRRQADDRTNGTKFATPPKGRTRRTSKRGAPEADDDETVATPWTSSKRRASVRERSTIPDSEDELANRNSPSATISASTRRRAHRADHINNQAEEIVVPSDDEQAGVGALEEDDYGMEVDGNSAMGSVLDPTEPSPFNKPASAQKTKPALRLLHGHLEPGHERQLEVLKSIMLERIAGKRPGALIGLAEEYKTVHQLIEHTVTAGESNSMLLIGARGSGKSALVNKVLSEISKENSEDYHIVRLNGFIHTDDKIALREIWRQLGKEMDLDEEGGGVGKNYADTLTTLLALLSHHSEHTGEVTDQVAKAVIFIMDEFDHFAQHPRQTLLYNLFDIAQSRKAPIAVLGLTTRIDVANSLEKRVKSRFSHRYVHLSLAKTFTAFQETCKANLLVLSEQLNVEERGILEGAVQATPAKKGKKGAKQDLLLQWNANVNVRAHLPITPFYPILNYPRPSSHPKLSSQCSLARTSTARNPSPQSSTRSFSPPPLCPRH